MKHRNLFLSTTQRNKHSQSLEKLSAEVNNKAQIRGTYVWRLYRSQYFH